MMHVWYNAPLCSVEKVYTAVIRLLHAVESDLWTLLAVTLTSAIEISISHHSQHGLRT